MGEKNLAIGIDLGGTKIEIGLVKESGEVCDRIRLETKAKGGPDAVQKQLIQGIEKLIKRAADSFLSIKGIGVGVAGQIEAETGIVRFAPNLPGWNNIPLGQNLQEAFNVPVTVINDVRAITWGEWIFGAGKGGQDLICLFVGTGIGSGIVSGGQLLKGGSNTCGEVGHMTVDFNGLECTCGNRGCLEAYAGGWGVAYQAKEAIQSNSKAGSKILKLAGGKIEDVTAKNVVEAYRDSDPLAYLILEKAKFALIAGCVNLVHAFNPTSLILGGGLVDGLPEWISDLEKGVKEFALKAAVERFQIIPAKLGKEAGVIGAAAVIHHHLKEK